MSDQKKSLGDKFIYSAEDVDVLYDSYEPPPTDEETPPAEDTKPPQTKASRIAAAIDKFKKKPN